MKQQMRFGSEAPKRRTHSRYGMQTMRLLGHRHLGSASALYRDERKQGCRAFQHIDTGEPLGCGPEHDTLGYNAGGCETPKRDQQLSGKRHDHGCLAGAVRAGCAPHVPSCERAVPLKDKEPPSKLNETAPHASVAGSGESFFPTRRTTLIG